MDRSGDGLAERGTSVVIMAYNEAETLRSVCEEIRRELASRSDPFEILIVDDGSKDGTGPVADGLAAENPCYRVVHHSPNLGLGGVYRTGFREARGRFLTFMPADGQFVPSVTNELRALMDGHDLVLSYVEGLARPPLARFFSWAERCVYHVLFCGFPRFQGVFMIRREVLDAIALTSSGGRGWGIVMEMIVRVGRAKKRIVSIPTVLRPREKGASKVTSWRTAWANLKQALSLRLALWRGR